MLCSCGALSCRVDRCIPDDLAISIELTQYSVHCPLPFVFFDVLVVCGLGQEHPVVVMYY